MSTNLILRTDITGQPIGWINWRQAAILYVKGLVVWETGNVVKIVKSGISRILSKRLSLNIKSIIATEGISKVSYNNVPGRIKRTIIFSRDDYTCAYCGIKLKYEELTYDHIIPKSKGGITCWTNIITACKPCNNWKGSQSIKDSGMELLFQPTVPNKVDYLILKNRSMLDDQKCYIKEFFSK